MLRKKLESLPLLAGLPPPRAIFVSKSSHDLYDTAHACNTWLLRLRTGSDFAPARLPAPDPALHVSAPVADARLGLASSPIWGFLSF